MAYHNPFNTGERDVRSGVYKRIVNRSYSPFTGPSGDASDHAILVSPYGVMYGRGPVLSVAVGDDGARVLVFQRGTGVRTDVIGETLEIKNPGG